MLVTFLFLFLSIRITLNVAWYINEHIQMPLSIELTDNSGMIGCSLVERSANYLDSSKCCLLAGVPKVGQGSNTYMGIGNSWKHLVRNGTAGIIETSPTVFSLYSMGQDLILNVRAT